MVEVRVTREQARSPFDVPFAVAVARPDSVRPGLRQSSLDEQLFLVPGVTVVNRHNPTQDPRVSVRGFGARSAFGVRGVRILRDGIPLTLPDGQTPVDYVELESVARVEAIRGSASSLYGNAAGGVIDLRSVDPPPQPALVRLRQTVDNAAPPRSSAALAGTTGMIGYVATVVHADGNSFRDYSRQRTTHGFGRATARVGAVRASLTAMTFDMPLAQNPGALTLAELRADPSRADSLSEARQAAKAVVQRQFGLTATSQLFGGDVTGVVYTGTRRLDNPTSFAVVDVRRASSGASVQASMPIRVREARHLATFGIDVQRQDDDRRNFANCAGTAPGSSPACPVATAQRGTVTLDQREIVSSVGPYARVDVGLGERVRLGTGVRADVVTFELRDRFVSESNPDDSGERTLRAVSPSLGAVVRLRPLTAAYLNVSTAFETPTATELVNQPDGSAGLNRDLQPQTALTYEAGVKGVTARLQYDLALFATRVREELIPFEVPGGSGRRYFRNAGGTGRRGAELSLFTTVSPIDVSVAYTFTRLRFDDYTVGPTSYAGNAIPGVPPHQVQASVSWRRSSVFVTADGQIASAAFVDDANLTRAPAYEVVHVRAGATRLFGGPFVSLAAGVNNVFNERYAPSIAVNAGRGKYYEPAPGRSAYVLVGVSVGGR